ncbi:hypothetical protein E8E12_008533 [Didymella heteroderae]|uniref:EngB-type G domain-containing protein n=1 Tax=Didymella heteroderae TaxID=1769908 RepID=A0A9P4WPE4_9PLEO|nr:hypothetical protein E8E12_008533 [Didymella heteroderae]
MGERGGAAAKSSGTRGLRVRPRARQPRAEAEKTPPTETVTLTDGTTIRVQAERPQKGAAATAATAAPAAPAETPSTPAESVQPRPPTAQKPHDDDDLVPSSPSTLQSYPKSKTKSPPENPPTGPHDYNWYYETAPPSHANKTHANTFFEKHGQRATLLRSIAQFRKLPETDVPEVAFIGRSNVGKSSLLNAVMGCNTKALLARTSSTPGFTKTMNLYGIAPEPGVRIATRSVSGTGGPGRDKIVGPAGLVIVDMPGYGSGSLTQWGVEIMKYIQSRKALRRVFVLLDAEHGVKDKDRSILASLRLAGVSHQVVLSKMDKLYIPKAGEIKKMGKGVKMKSKGSVTGFRERMRALLPEIAPPHGGAALGEILACSSETLVDGKRLGVEDVRFAVLKAVGLEGEERKGFTESKKKKKKAVEAQA